MNTAKINYVAVGIFISVALVGFIVATAMLTGRTGATDEYYSIYKNVTGVKFGTQVLYEGYPIGQVETVTPVPEGGSMKFRIDYEVIEGWKIPDDSVARIGASGLLSAITINIDAGTSPVSYKPGSAVRAQEAADIFKVMSGVAGDISNIAENDLRPLLATINTAVANFAITVETVGNLLDEDGQRMVKQFAAIADDLSKLVLDFNERLPRIAENVDTSAANFADLSANLEQTRAELDQLLAQSQGLIKQGQGFVGESQDVVGENRADIKKSIEDLKHVTESLARHIDSVNLNIEGAARNMYEFTREIRANPGVLLSGSSPQQKGK